MPESDIDLMAINRGTVIAPAGCGKTELISRALSRHEGSKPILVLTHTNAGVAALRGRLNRANVRPSAYRLSTIDGWARRLISTFPCRSNHDPAILELKNPRTDYPNIRRAAAGLLEAGHIGDILGSSFCRMFVDEYQDCSILQHSFISSTACVLPTCLLGDPLQAIFGFGMDGLANWEEVTRAFPVAGELSKPWRWINADSKDLGQWLLDIREWLIAGDSVDLGQAPDAVEWVKLDGKNDREKHLRAARVRCGDGAILIIGDSKNPDSQRKIASQTPGAVTIEAVDLRDLVTFASDFNPSSSEHFEILIRFSQKLMTNVGASELIRRVISLRSGRARNGPTTIEQSALSFIDAPSALSARNLLEEISRGKKVRIYRRTVFRACVTALQQCADGGGLSFYESAIRIREKYRACGRPLPRRAVGSTLLLKGLEADVAVVLDADSLDKNNLYVALTRGSSALTICSKTQILSPI